MSKWDMITAVGTAILALVGFLGWLEKTYSTAFLQFIEANLYYTIILLLVFITLPGIRLLFDNIGSKVHDHLTIHYFGRNNSPLRPHGFRLVHNTSTNQAYWVNTRLDKLAKKEIIDSATHPCEEMNEWVTTHRLTPPDDFPTTQELLEGSPSRHWSVVYRSLQ